MVVWKFGLMRVIVVITLQLLRPSEKRLEPERATTSQIVSKQIHRVPSSAIVSRTLTGHTESHAA